MLLYSMVYEDQKIVSIKEIREELGTVVSLIDLGFPHISKKIIKVWGTPEFYDYSRTLLIDDRGDRKGFPLEILQEIMEIISIHDKQFPNIKRMQMHKGLI